MPESRALADLHPYFQPIVAEVLARAWEEGSIFPFLTSTRRSFELQACLYAQGRLRPGSSATYDGFTVTARKSGAVVVARCGAEEIRRSPVEWSRTVTSALPRASWHTLGFAADFAFRSSPEAKDVRYDVSMYRELAKLFREVCPAVRWGNDWDGDGIEVGPDPDESRVDLPHFEYHPGRSLADVAAGRLPAYPKQCPTCGVFPATFVGEFCAECAGAR